jgi:hypothetical protein
MNAYPFAVDSHVCLVVDAQVLDFVNLPDAFHVSGIATCTKDYSYTRARVDIRRGNERPGSVIDDRRQFRRYVLKERYRVKMTMAVSERGESYPYVFFQALAEHVSDVPALGVGRSETLCPTNEFAVIDTLLPVYPKTHVLGMANHFGNDTTHEHGYEN